MSSSRSLSPYGRLLAKEALANKGLSISDLAKLTGFARSTVTNFFSCNRVSISIYNDLCNRLGIDGEQASSDCKLPEKISLADWINHGISQADWNPAHSDFVQNSSYNLRNSSLDILGCNNIPLGDDHRVNLLLSISSKIDRDTNKIVAEVTVKMFPQLGECCLPVGVKLCVLTSDLKCPPQRKAVGEGEKLSFIKLELGLAKGDDIIIIVAWEKFKYIDRFIF